jgi:GNAT superfamily N-acetyltransferase
MIEYALEQFPVSHALSNGIECLIRTLTLEDEQAFMSFQQAVPTRERFLLKHRIKENVPFQEWCHDLDYDRHLPLIALVDGKIVGYATLHQRPGGWKRHIGMVGALIHPAYRGVGVLRTLLGELVDVAKHCGLTKVEAEFNGERKNTILSFEKCGFTELVRLPDYLQDMEAQAHDYVLLGLDLGVDYEYAGTGD